MVFCSTGQSKDKHVDFWNQAFSDWDGNMPQMSGFVHWGDSRININAYFLDCLFLFLKIFWKETDLREKSMTLFL